MRSLAVAYMLALAGAAVVLAQSKFCHELLQTFFVVYTVGKLLTAKG